MTWDQMTKIEPKLGQLLEEIQSIKDDQSQVSFCANDHFHGGDPSLKERMCELVGWDAAQKELRTSEIYDLAREKLYNALPDCRNCGCPSLYSLQL